MIELLLLFALLGVIVAAILMVTNRGKKRRENPDLLIKFAEEMDWSFQPGKEARLVPRIQTPATATGSRNGKPVVLRYTSTVIDAKGKSRSELDYLEIDIPLATLWDSIQLRQRSVAQVQNELVGAEVPTGDPGFDNEFVLTGRVDDTLKARLRNRQIQRSLRGLIDDTNADLSILSGALLTERRINDEDVDQILNYVDAQIACATLLDADGASLEIDGELNAEKRRSHSPFGVV